VVSSWLSTLAGRSFSTLTRPRWPPKNRYCWKRRGKKGKEGERREKKGNKGNKGNKENNGKQGKQGKQGKKANKEKKKKKEKISQHLVHGHQDLEGPHRQGRQRFGQVLLAVGRDGFGFLGLVGAHGFFLLHDVLLDIGGLLFDLDFQQQRFRVRLGDFQFWLEGDQILFHGVHGVGGFVQFCQAVGVPEHQSHRKKVSIDHARPLYFHIK
jgi:hypothetical protein